MEGGSGSDPRRATDPPTGTTPRNTPNQGVDTPQSGDIDQDVPKPDPWGDPKHHLLNNTIPTTSNTCYSIDLEHTRLTCCMR